MFCASMNTIKEVEKQFTEWEKMFVHPVLTRDLYLENIKTIINNKKGNSPIKTVRVLCISFFFNY